MVNVNKVHTQDGGVFVEYETSGITISTIVKGDLPEQEILQKGFDELYPLLKEDCDQRGVELDTELPKFESYFTSIEILGVNDVTFTEGQTPIEMKLRCVGTTNFGKKLNLTPLATFSKNPVLIDTKTSYTDTIEAKYDGLSDFKQFNVKYISLAEIEAENERIRLEEEKRLKREEIDRLKTEITDTDYKIIKCSEYQLQGLELPYDISELHAERQSKRDRINELEKGE